MFINYVQKPLRTWEKIEVHRTSIKDHALKVKRQILLYNLMF